MLFRTKVAGAPYREWAHRLYEGRFTLRVIALTSAAAGVAWALCIPLGSSSSAFAAASSVYAVQLTVRSSLVDGLKRSGVMGASLLIAVVILRAFGLSIAAVILAVFVSMAAGRLLRFSVTDSLQVPATAIFVLALGTSVGDWGLLSRGLATLVGAVVGAIGSVVAHAGDPQNKARQAVSGIDGAVASLLEDMSTGLARGLSASDGRQWLARSRELDVETQQARALVDQAVAFLQGDPLGRRDDAAELSLLYTSAQHSVFQTRDIARTLFEVSLGATPKVLAPQLVRLLGTTGAAFRLRASGSEGEPPDLDGALAAVRASHSESLDGLRQANDTGVWLASGNILSDVQRMVQQLDGSTPALGVLPAKDPSE